VEGASVNKQLTDRSSGSKVFCLSLSLNTFKKLFNSRPATALESPVFLPSFHTKSLHKFTSQFLETTYEIGKITNSVSILAKNMAALSIVSQFQQVSHLDP
jgi:hypothetical protein